ncbi:MAG: molecular chaperone DnaK [Deltaproteobacteria bacterium]|nr:molecular chaperone DnaK [Deltaproteobacteria bacterium]
MEPVIGIDLGTTNSVVATVQAGVPTVIPNRSGYRLTPSVVAIAKNGKRLVGQLARRQAVTNAERTVVAVKRLMGRKYSSRALQEALPRLPYSVVNGDRDDPHIVLGDKSYTPPEISAMILTELRLDAEAFLGEKVGKAVITVPAYFNDGQRNATKDAGRIAGLDVIRIINEPTSASLAYGFGRDVQEKKICVFDLGGGTFDFTVLHMFKGVFEVMATGGDTALGGEDFDARIIDWLAEPFARTHGVDLRKDKMSLQRLRDAAEKAKCELSAAKSTEVNLPFIAQSPTAGPLHLQAQLTRDMLEKMTDDLVQRTLRVCEQVMSDAKVHAAQLGDVLMVGGQTRMPRVHDAVKSLFGREPSKNINPDEAVAVGAAVQGHLLLNETGKESDMLLLDVTPHSLGIAIAGGYFSRIIPKNTTVPTSAHHIFTTVKDGQTSAKITVVQGESELAAQNELLGEFMLMGLREAPRGEVDIDVIFDISSDGIVSVSAIDVQTGQRQSITVTASSGLTEDEIRNAAAANEDWLLTQKSDPEFEARKNTAERLFKEFEELWPRLTYAAKNGLGQEALQRAQAALSVARLQVSQKESEGLAGSIERLERMLGALRGAIERSGQGGG